MRILWSVRMEIGHYVIMVWLNFSNQSVYITSPVLFSEFVQSNTRTTSPWLRPTRRTVLTHYAVVRLAIRCTTPILTLTPIFWADNWYTGYFWPAERSRRIWLHPAPFVLELAASMWLTDRWTDGRTGKTRIAACWDGRITKATSWLGDAWRRV